MYVPVAVAQAAMESGVARQKLDLADYRRRLEETVANL
jgi:malic enzyme